MKKSYTVRETSLLKNRFTGTIVRIANCWDSIEGKNGMCFQVVYVAGPEEYHPGWFDFEELMEYHTECTEAEEVLYGIRY